MNLTFSEEEEAFRQEVRAWVREAMPEDMLEKARGEGHYTPLDTLRWHRILHEKGWIAPHWPKEVGGTGWDAARMDSLMLLAKRERSLGYSGEGDFHIAADGRLARRGADETSPYVFTGV